MRCKHANVWYLEEAKQYLQWGISDGDVRADPVSEPDLTGVVEVECLDCGLKRTYRSWKSRPAWVKQLDAAIQNRPDVAPVYASRR